MSDGQSLTRRAVHCPSSVPPYRRAVEPPYRHLQEVSLTSPRYLAAYYFWYFSAVGIFEPFLTPWWRQIGFSPTEIGLLSALMPATAAVAPFLWTAIADATRQGERIFLVNTWVCGLAALLLPLLGGFVGVGGAVVLFALARAPLVPLANSMIFQALGRRREGYAAIRLWGTLGYIVTAVCGGLVVDRIGLRASLFGVALAMGLAGSIAWRGRSRERVPLPSVGLQDILETLRDRRLLLLVTAAGLAWMSYGPYATFYTIHLDRLGYSRSFAGLAWALAAGSELVVMLCWSRIGGWLAGRTWFLIGLAASPVRWSLAAMAEGVPLLLLTQLVHAASFGVFYLAAVERVDRLAAPGLRATAQGILAAVTFGVGGLCGMLGGGLAFERIGMRGLYLASAGVSLAGVVLYWAGSRDAGRGGREA